MAAGRAAASDLAPLVLFARSPSLRGSLARVSALRCPGGGGMGTGSLQWSTMIVCRGGCSLRFMCAPFRRLTPLPRAQLAPARWFARGRVARYNAQQYGSNRSSLAWAGPPFARVALTLTCGGPACSGAELGRGPTRAALEESSTREALLVATAHRACLPYLQAHRISGGHEEAGGGSSEDAFT